MNNEELEFTKLDTRCRFVNVIEILFGKFHKPLRVEAGLTLTLT